MKSRSPAISVIIPTFNRAAMLTDTLESFAAQSIPTNRYEVIVVDDGSKDTTPEVCRDFGSRMQLRYLHVENSGISAAKRSDLGIHDVGADAFGYAVDALRHRYSPLPFCLWRSRGWADA